MAAKQRLKNSAVLRIRWNGKSSTPLTRDQWVRILDHDLFRLSDGFALVGYDSSESLFRRSVFNFASLEDILFSRTIKHTAAPLAGRSDLRNFRTEIAVFALNEAAKRALRFAPFGEWSAAGAGSGSSSGSGSEAGAPVVNELLFYAGETLIARTVDTDVLFFELSLERLKTLCAADKTLAKNFWRLPELDRLYVVG